MAVVTYKKGEKDQRPWGSWEVLDVGDGVATKRIRVLPGKRLSYQRHAHRREHWLVVQGRARVTCDGELLELGLGEAVDIPQGAWHRVENPGPGDMEFVEVQRGERLDEADIERSEDDFGRAGEAAP
jgi:mannose-6-phosphate isomerase-like protein (cupin superfamily)